MKRKLTFTEKVLWVVELIPKGKTLSYAEVARRVGSPKAFRTVGSVMRKNYNQNIPCHRVIRSDGTAGGYNRGGMRAKLRKLRAEGVILPS